MDFSTFNCQLSPLGGAAGNLTKQFRIKNDAFSYSYHNNFLPHTLNTIFVTNRQVHTYNTRNTNNYRPYFCRTNIKQFTILHLEPKLWNSLPHNLSELTSYFSFKTSFKKIPYRENYKLNSPDHDMAVYSKS